MSEIIVKQFSSEWMYVSFRIQLLFGHPNIKILSIKKNKPTFSNTYENFLKIDGAIDVTNVDLPSIQSIKSSLKKDLVLKAGRIINNIQNSSAQKQKKYRVILLKLAINQALPCFKQPYLTSQDFLINNPQYDSVYCMPRQQEISIFNHDYMVKETQQYQWEYDVEFSYKEFEQWNQQNYKCQNCKLQKAKLYCLQDKEVYCQSCYYDVHKSDKKMKHKKQNLNPYNCPLRCPKSQHQSQQLNYYCFYCQELKCKNCLSDGLHKLDISNNDSMHQVMESRQLAIQFKQKQKQNFSEIKIRITALIREVQTKIQLISSHYDIKLKQLVRWFQQRSKIVGQQAKSQLNIATGFHCQLKRKYDEILWLQSYINELQPKCNANDGMKVKQGVHRYLNQAISPEYFKLIEKKVQDLKIFN